MISLRVGAKRRMDATIRWEDGRAPVERREECGCNDYIRAAEVEIASRVMVGSRTAWRTATYGGKEEKGRKGVGGGGGGGGGRRRGAGGSEVK